MSAHVLSPVVLRTYPDFGEQVIFRLERTMYESQKTQALFAAEAGISAESLCRLRRNEGRALPTLGTLAALALGHDVALEWLVFGQGPSRRSDQGAACPVCVPRMEGAA